MATRARGKVTIDSEECNGCGVCVDACPPKCFLLLPDMNVYGVHPAHYTGENCSLCGICFRNEKKRLHCVNKRFHRADFGASTAFISTSLPLRRS